MVLYNSEVSIILVSFTVESITRTREVCDCNSPTLRRRLIG